MFDQLVVGGQLLLSVLQNLPAKKNKKQVVGRKLSNLHYDLTLLCENGNIILDLFDEYNNGKPANIQEIKSLLSEQYVLIPRLLRFFDDSNIQTVLNIKAPDIKPLRFLLFVKDSRVRFYLDEIGESEKRIHSLDRITWLEPRIKIELPKHDSIERSRQQIQEIEAITESLRNFIIEQFEIDEII